MKKILVAIDGSRYSETALDYALELNKREESLIIGIFIQDMSYVYMLANYGIEPQPYEYSYDIIQKVTDEDEKEIYGFIRAFNEKCRKAGVSFKVHLDRGVPAHEIVKESMFADLVVIGYQTFFGNISSAPDEGLLRDILQDAKCPVIVLPEAKKEVHHVIFAYDGKESSVFAIKQFSYLFTDLYRSGKFSFLTVLKDKDEKVKHEGLIREYLQAHFPSVQFLLRHGNPDEEISKYVAECEDCMLVMGAFGRSTLSRLFASSTAKSILHAKAIPAFIAHM
ncbi:MAG: universal stress protein [Bacteroidia bacterium]